VTRVAKKRICKQIKSSKVKAMGVGGGDEMLMSGQCKWKPVITSEIRARMAWQMQS